MIDDEDNKDNANANENSTDEDEDHSKWPIDTDLIRENSRVNISDSPARMWLLLKQLLSLQKLTSLFMMPTSITPIVINISVNCLRMLH